MELDKALADIRAMRDQVARGTEFRGYGPAAFAVTGVLAALAGVAQSRLIPDPSGNVAGYLELWIVTAAIAATPIGIEVIWRTRSVHAGLADEMIVAAATELLPCVLAGLVLTLVLWNYASQELWMLPGLWQIILSLGIFSACRTLPGLLKLVAVWYLATGAACLAAAHGDHAFSPLAMGVPFTIGEILAAFLIAVTGGRGGEDSEV